MWKNAKKRCHKSVDITMGNGIENGVKRKTFPELITSMGRVIKEGDNLRGNSFYMTMYYCKGRI